MLLFRLLRNKYFLSFTGLLVWVTFFDKNDLFSQYELVQKCAQLEQEKEYYITEIENNKKNLLELKTNKKSLETFAREQYLMKKENEEVFVFVSR